jgi:hypothetical protein
MAEPDDNALELLERRLSERVIQRARSALVATFVAGLSVVGAILTYVGFNAFEQVKSIAEERAAQIVDRDVKPQASEAGKLLGDIKVQFGVLRELSVRAREDMERLERQLTDFQPRAAALDRFSQKVDEIDLRSKELQASFATARLTIDSLTTLNGGLERLARQVDELNELVGQGTPQPLKAEYEPRQRAITGGVSEVIEKSQQLTQQVQSYATRTTVFVQYYAMPRAQADALVKALNERGYNVPNPDQQPMSRAGVREVRYFWPADAPAAATLAGDAQAVLKAQNLGAQPVEVRNLTDWPRQKPKAGTLELWIGLPSTAAAD